MKTVDISVTEVARNFADCVNRAHYQGTTFVLHKNGVAVARIVPETPLEKPVKGAELAAARREALTGLHLTAGEADVFRKALKETRKRLQGVKKRT